MLMNGKEVNHLVINGDRFDKSYVGKRVKITPTSGASFLHFYPAVNGDGTLRDFTDLNYIVDRGDEVIILAKYMDCIFIANSKNPPATNANGNRPDIGFGWIDVKDVTFLD